MLSRFISQAADLIDLATERLTDIAVGTTWTGVVSAGVGTHTGVGAALALNPTMLLVGVLVGAIAVPILRHLKKKGHSQTNSQNYSQHRGHLRCYTGGLK
ncbi:MAG TPA: hypothetical protein V6D16_08810 [Candidatus Obscuribacterales bacterium]